MNNFSSNDKGTLSVCCEMRLRGEIKEFQKELVNKASSENVDEKNNYKSTEPFYYY